MFFEQKYSRAKLAEQNKLLLEIVEGEPYETISDRVFGDPHPATPVELNESIEVSTAHSNIDLAYATLDALLVERHVNGASPRLNQEIGAAWEHLRLLQDQEATKIREQLDRTLELPSNELRRLVAEATALLGK